MAYYGEWSKYLASYTSQLDQKIDKKSEQNICFSYRQTMAKYNLTREDRSNDIDQ